MPELNLARTAVLDYFEAQTDLRKILCWENGETFDANTAAFFDSLNAEVAFPRDNMPSMLMEQQLYVTKNYPEVMFTSGKTNRGDPRRETEMKPTPPFFPFFSFFFLSGWRRAVYLLPGHQLLLQVGAEHGPGVPLPGVPAGYGASDLPVEWHQL